MEKSNDNYPIDEHIHRFACWTAARAASIGRFSNKEICQFIAEIGLRNQLELLRKQQITSEDYEEWFIRQVDNLLERMNFYFSGKEKDFFRNISFGIAAKVISIYVKTAEVIPTKGLSSISKVAFPPVDSYLLKGLKIKGKAWSGLDKNGFMNLINDLKILNDGNDFWKLEASWNLNS